MERAAFKNIKQRPSCSFASIFHKISIPLYLICLVNNFNLLIKTCNKLGAHKVQHLVLFHKNADFAVSSSSDESPKSSIKRHQNFKNQKHFFTTFFNKFKEKIQL